MILLPFPRRRIHPKCVFVWVIVWLYIHKRGDRILVYTEKIYSKYSKRESFTHFIHSFPYGKHNIIEVWLREGVATLMDVRQNEILLTSSFFLSSHECAHFSTLTKGVSILVLSRNISCNNIKQTILCVFLRRKDHYSRLISYNKLESIFCPIKKLLHIIVNVWGEIVLKYFNIMKTWRVEWYFDWNLRTISQPLYRYMANNDSGNLPNISD